MPSALPVASWVLTSIAHGSQFKCMRAGMSVLTVRLQTCGWGTLGRQLGRDLDDLPDIFEGSEREMMSQAIDSIKVRYLIRSTIIDFPFCMV